MKDSDIRELMRIARAVRIGRKHPLTKDEARAMCSAAVTLVEPRRVAELPKAKRFRQYWRAFHDYTKK
jgi:hypothetical protein